MGHLNADLSKLLTHSELRPT